MAARRCRTIWSISLTFSRTARAFHRRLRAEFTKQIRSILSACTRLPPAKAGRNYGCTAAVTSTLSAKLMDLLTNEMFSESLSLNNNTKQRLGDFCEGRTDLRAQRRVMAAQAGKTPATRGRY
jgi:hypothetical protein